MAYSNYSKVQQKVPSEEEPNVSYRAFPFSSNQNSYSSCRDSKVSSDAAGCFSPSSINPYASSPSFIVPPLSSSSATLFSGHLQNQQQYTQKNTNSSYNFSFSAPTVVENTSSALSFPLGNSSLHYAKPNNYINKNPSINNTRSLFNERKTNANSTSNTNHNNWTSYNNTRTLSSFESFSSLTSSAPEISYPPKFAQLAAGGVNNLQFYTHNQDTGNHVTSPSYLTELNENKNNEQRENNMKNSVMRENEFMNTNLSNQNINDRIYGHLDKMNHSWSNTNLSNANANEYFDDPPLLEDLEINLDHIIQRMKSVLLFRRLDHDLLSDCDMCGPFFIAMCFGFCLLLAGKATFGHIYGFGIIGCFGMYILLNLMGQIEGIDLYRTASILGYSLLPVACLALISIFITLRRIPGSILAVSCILWCTATASRFFETALRMHHQRYLIAYPISLLYTCFVLITVF